MLPANSLIQPNNLAKKSRNFFFFVCGILSKMLSKNTLKKESTFLYGKHVFKNDSNFFYYTMIK